MNAKELLIDARDRIAKPENWTTGAYARDAFGHAIQDWCLPKSSATCWCASGSLELSIAIAMQSDESDEDIYYQVRMAKATLSRYAAWNIAAFNDHATHSSVIEAFNNAIESLPDKE